MFNTQVKHEDKLTVVLKMLNSIETNAFSYGIEGNLTPLIINAVKA